MTAADQRSDATASRHAEYVPGADGWLAKGVVLAPPPQAVYAFAVLSAEERGADVEPIEDHPRRGRRPMIWAKVDDRLYVSRRAALRFAPEHGADLAAILVKHDLWTEAEDGWRIDGYLADFEVDG